MSGATAKSAGFWRAHVRICARLSHLHHGNAECGGPSSNMVHFFCLARLYSKEASTRSKPRAPPVNLSECLQCRASCLGCSYFSASRRCDRAHDLASELLLT